MSERDHPAPTPSQTVGPYFTMIVAGTDDDWRQPATAGASGEHVVLRGRLLDGRGSPIEDGLVELWQADAEGRHLHPLDAGPPAAAAPRPAFVGFARCATSFDGGAWSFTTIRPGRVPAADGTPQAPHVTLTVQARGMLVPVWTRAYFDDEAAANDADPVLAAVPPDRRATMVARREGSDDAGRPVFVLDLRMQGPDETVFLDW